jgi:hypothetical protein
MDVKKGKALTLTKSAQTLPVVLVGADRLLTARCQSLLELVNSTASINKLLLTGKEGMALGANINSQLTALGRTSYNALTTCALHYDFFVIRMDSGLHLTHLTIY